MPNYNTRLITLRRSYLISEVASLFGIHQRTCHRWIRNDGLRVIEENVRPLLVMGTDLISFLKVKRAKRKAILRKEDDFYCMKCHKVVKAKRGSEKAVKTGKKIGKAGLEQIKRIGICEICGTKVNRFLRGVKQN